MGWEMFSVGVLLVGRGLAFPAQSFVHCVKDLGRNGGWREGRDGPAQSRHSLGEGLVTHLCVLETPPQSWMLMRSVLQLSQPLRLCVHLPGQHRVLGSVSEKESPMVRMLMFPRDESWRQDFCCQMPVLSHGRHWKFSG